MESQMSSFVGESYEQFLNGIYEAVNICGRSVDKDEERPFSRRDGSALVVDFNY